MSDNQCDRHLSDPVVSDQSVPQEIWGPDTYLAKYLAPGFSGTVEVWLVLKFLLALKIYKILSKSYKQKRIIKTHNNFLAVIIRSWCIHTLVHEKRVFDHAV